MLNISLSLSLSLSPYTYGASIAQLAGSCSSIREVPSSIPASATTEWVTKQSPPLVCRGVSSLKSHRSPGPLQPLVRGIILSTGRTARDNPSSQSQAARRELLPHTCLKNRQLGHMV